MASTSTGGGPFWVGAGVPFFIPVAAAKENPLPFEIVAFLKIARLDFDAIPDFADPGKQLIIAVMTRSKPNTTPPDSEPMTVRQPVAHDSAARHVSGEALYVDDLPTPSRTPHAAIGQPEAALGTSPNRLTGRLGIGGLGGGRAAPALPDAPATSEHALAACQAMADREARS